MAISKQAARDVSNILDKAANEIQSKFAELGVPERIAVDFATRCDHLADHIEKTAGWDPTNIGKEVAGPAKAEADEPFMKGEFTQQENRELRGLQEAGKLGPKVVDGPRPPSAGKQAFEVSFANLAKQAHAANLAKLAEDEEDLDESDDEEAKKLAKVVASFRAQAAKVGDKSAASVEAVVAALNEVVPHIASKDARVSRLASMASVVVARHYTNKDMIEASDEETKDAPVEDKKDAPEAK
jgi:hypothetical protein